jgi:two-component system response regulator
VSRQAGEARAHFVNPLPTRILIVEDNVDDAELLLRQLEKAQLHQQVRVIAHGGIALDYLTDAQAECENLIAVFLDLNLPDVSGLQILEGIRSSERTRHLPVILMTSSNAPSDMERCRALGVASYVNKPVSFFAFTKAVADIFHRT